MSARGDRWQRLQSLFEEAIDVPVRARAALLDDACRHDPSLRAEIDAMIAAHAPARALAIERMVNDDRPVTTSGRGADAAGGDDPFIGTRLGPWRIVGVEGHGGMGTVYRAERADGQYEQRVALKLVRAAAAPGRALSRFQAECQILARLSHPNIARLLDAGTTSEGSPYLVMEYVDGAPLTTWCDERRLTVDQRLALFRVVCAATQHAHQSLVVHRDLKPSNVFVSRVGEVKLLDFGIAKVIDADPAPDDVTAEWRVLTPTYAAPEQLRGDPVTTATDVYVLGIVLYELLTGRRPFADAEGGDAVAERWSADAGPMPPSRAVTRAVPRPVPRLDPETLARARGTSSPRRLAKRLAGDLDRVVLKALEAEPARRYASAGQLAEDIDRLLDGRPVIAQPDTLAYRTRRFVARHRVGVAIGAAVALIVTTFGVTAAVQARAAARARDRAQTEATRAQQVLLLVADLFRLAEPGAGRGDTIAARELLDRGTGRIAAELKDDARAQAELYAVIGRVYANLGLPDRAIAVLEQALARRRGLGASDASALAETLDLLGSQAVRTSDYGTAIAHFREALSLRRQVDAPPEQIAQTLEGLGRALSVIGKHDDAETPLRESVRIRRALPGRSSADTMSGLHELALTLHRQGDFKNAELLFREAVDEGRRVPDRTPAKVNGLLHLARLTHRFDRDARRAEPMYREALAAARALYPGDHPDTATCLTELSRGVRDLGRLVEAEALSRQGLAMLRRLYGARHREVMITAQTLAGLLVPQGRQGAPAAQGRVSEAESLSREAFGTATSLFGLSHPMTLSAQRALAAVLEAQRQYDEARRLREAGLKAALDAFGEQDVYVAITLAGLGEHCLLAGSIADATAYLRRALAVRQRLHPAGDWRIDDASARLGAALVRAGLLAEAEPLLVKAHAALARSRGADSPETRSAARTIGELRGGQRKAPRTRASALTGLGLRHGLRVEQAVQP